VPSELTITVTPTPLTFRLEAAEPVSVEGEVATFRVVASEPVQTTYQVAFQLVPGTAGAGDFAFSSFNPVTVTIAPGATTATFQVLPLSDELSELPESYSVQATVTGAVVSFGDAVAGTVLDSPNQTYRLTVANTDNVQAGLGNDLIIGARSNTVLFSGTASTYNPGDIVNGGDGTNTLRLFMDQGSVADGVAVSNVQQLDLRLNASGASGEDSELVMTDWDESLQKVDILSNKSRLQITEQKTVADVTIRDLSTADQASSYEFQYAAGVVDGSDDVLNLGVDNVNGTGGANVVLDGGLEAVRIAVNDRVGTQANPDRYSSEVNLHASGVDSVAVTGGRAGQTFSLNADVATGADLDATEFAGNMDLTSGDIRTARLGAGNDTVTLTGQANRGDSSYNLGDGDNKLTYAGTLGGAVTAGSGNDQVTVSATAAGSSIAVGDGTNGVTVTGAHAGTITGGEGDDTVTAASTAANSAVNVGDGGNTVAVAGAHAGSITAGSGDNTVTAASTAAGSTVNVGDGGNTVAVDGAHAGSITAGSGDDTVTAASTAAGSTVNVGDGGNTVAVVGAHAGSITAGSGDDTVTVTGVHAGSIVAGDGDNEVFAGSVTDGSITLGDGSNTVDITGDVSASAPGTIAFGDGSDNTLTIGGNLNHDAVVFGDGANNSFTIGDDVTNGASITLGDGGNTGWIKGDVEGGSTVTFGAGGDDLLLGVGDNSGSPKLRGTDVATEIDMGGGDDQVTMLAKSGGATNELVQSGGFMDGSADDDTLTLRTEQTVNNLIARTGNQEVTVDFTGKTFTVGQVVTITFTRGETTFTVSHTVGNADFVQGLDGVPAKVAEALQAKLDVTTAAYDAHFAPAARTVAKLTITSDTPHADFSVTSSVGDVDVVQISDTRITSFETLNLVVENDADKAAAQNVAIGANFDLIEGTNAVNLDSQVERVETINDPLLDGAYTTYGAGGVTTFNLSNLEGGEAISVAGHEASATGTQQVSRITVDTGDGDHVVGDKIIVTIDGQEVTYTVTAADLVAATGQLDANNIATSLATAIASAASAAGMTVERDANVITLIGGAGDAVPVTVSHTRITETTPFNANFTAGQFLDVLTSLQSGLLPGDVIVITMGDDVVSSEPLTAEDCVRLNADGIVAFFDGQLEGAEAGFGKLVFNSAANVTVKRMVDQANPDRTAVTVTQPATATDDATTDVVINATRAVGSSDADMELTVDGHGAFDLSITGNNAANGYTDLSLTLADTFNHTIDLNGGTYSLVGAGEDEVQGNFSNSLTVVDEAGRSTAGQNIVLSEVLARTVNTTGADANFTIDQYTGVRTTAADFAGEVISVTTGSGNDHLRTLAQSALTDNSGSGGQQSSINLGSGSNTLALGWGSGITLGSADLAALGNIDYSGDLTQLNILNAVELANGSTTVFRMPGQATGVDVLTFTDVDVASNGVASLTIEGAASTFRIESGFDLAEDQEDRIVLEVVGVENLSIEVGDEVNVDLNGASLQTLEIVAGDDVDFVMDGSKTGNNNFINLTAITLAADDNVAALISHVRGGASLSVTADANRGLNGEADVTVSYVTLGDVSVVSTGDDDHFAELNVSGTVGTASSTAAASMGNVTVTSNADARLFVENNIDANVNVSGTVDIIGLGIGEPASGDAARLVVSGNTRTNVSLADGGTIDLVACGSDDDTRVTISNNLNNFLPDFGNPDQTAVTARNYAIDLGAIVANAGEDAIVSLTNNDDTTYYGDLAVTVDRVDLFAYEDASATIEGNNAATITIGTVDMLSQRNGTLAITNNDGGIYTVTPPGGSTRREVDFADITVGNVTIEADVDNLTDTGVQGDASFTVTGNDIARVQVGTIDVDAGGDATFRIDNNDDTTVTTLGVTINAEATATPTLTFSISDNDRVDNGATTVPPLVSSVTINGDVNLTAPSTTTVIGIDGNDGLSATLRSTVTVNGDFQSTSGGSITASINDNEFADVIFGREGEDDVLHLASSSDGVDFFIQSNIESTIVLSTTTIDAAEDAVLAVTDNVSSQVFGLAGRTTLDADDDAQFVIEDNGFGEVRFGDIQINASDDVTGAGGIGGGTVGFDIRDNTGGTIETGEVDINAGGDVDARIRENTDAAVTVGRVDIDGATVAVGVDDNLDSVIRSGNINIDATAGATLYVTGNVATAASKDSFVELAAVVTRDVTGAVTGITRNAITIDAATVGAYGNVAPTSWGVDVSANIESEIYLGNLSVTAAGTGENDVTMRLENQTIAAYTGIHGEDNTIDVGDIVVTADDDVYVWVDNVYGYEPGRELRTGDIALNSGLEPATFTGSVVNPVSSNLYFKAWWLEGNDLNNNVGTGDDGQQVTLTANSRGTGEGYVYAAIGNAPDLTSLTVQGSTGQATNGEVYLTGNIGGDTAGTNVFTLDLSGLTGAFGAGRAAAYNPLGVAATANADRNGSYVETWNATFGTSNSDVVRVEIGSGGLIYNAQHSEFGGVPSYTGLNAVNDWDRLDASGSIVATDEGWFSLGSPGARYLSPIVAQQSFTINGVSGDPTGPDADLAFMHAVLIETGTREFAAAIDYYWDDNNGGFGSSSWSRETGVIWYEFTGATYVVRSEAYVEAALGGVDITYNYGVDGTNVGATTVTITGNADGSAFDYIISASRNGGDGGDREFEALSGGGDSEAVSTTLGVVADDGLGNLAKEAFTFTGDAVGEVVIGGFNPGAWGQINPNNGRLTDQLDFSRFDWNGDGVADATDRGLVADISALARMKNAAKRDT